MNSSANDKTRPCQLHAVGVNTHLHRRSTMVPTVFSVCCLSIAGVLHINAAGLDVNVNVNVNVNINVKEQHPGSASLEAQPTSTSPDVTSSGKGNDRDTPATNTSGPFRLLRLSKEESEGMYRLRVDFQGPDPRSVNVRDYENGYEKYVTAEEPGVVTITVPVASSRSHQTVRLTFDLGEKRLSAEVWLRGKISSVEVPVFNVSQPDGNVATFESGQPAMISTSLEISDADSVKAVRPKYSIKVRSEKEPDVVMKYTSLQHTYFQRNPVWAEVEEEEQSPGLRLFSVVNSTLEHDLKGIFYMTFDMKFNCSEDCLLTEMQVPTDSVAFYRNGHRDPYPSDFIGFVVTDYYPSSLEFYCEVGDSRCTVMCEVIGNERPTMDFNRTDEGGMEPSAFTQTERLGPRWSRRWFTVHNVSWDHGGNFTCTARNGRKEVSRIIPLHVFQKPEIYRPFSNLTKLENGSMYAVCTARGVPAPHVTILTQYNDSNQGDDGVTVTSLDHRTKQAHIIYDPDVAKTVLHVECQANNNPVTTPDTLTLFENFSSQTVCLLC